MPELPNPSLLERPLRAGVLSRLATTEAWRKEVYSPPTHVQKWWAQRLGVVNRHLLMAAASSSQSELNRLDRGEGDLAGLVVYDPFSGSGSTLLEAAKLGAQVIGRDLNPVATFATRQALQKWDARELKRGFELVSDRCGAELSELYRDHNGHTIRGYFWVASAGCGDCDERVDLFHRHVFAQHAYPKKYPMAQGICRACGEVVKVDLSVDESISCHSCGSLTPIKGPVRSGAGTRAAEFECSSGHSTQIALSMKGRPIRFRMYAKLYEKGGKRVYERTDETDECSYERASSMLNCLGSTIVQPRGSLEPGKSTDQVLRVGLEKWRDFFNDRQLLSLGLIATAIRDLTIGAPEREALAAAFSKSIEFNNMLASYKGEGTGAVRSAFHSHTLQFERMPFEANPWSTSSGGFHAYCNRLLKALDYKESPTDLKLVRGVPKRVTGRSNRILLQITDSSEFGSGLASVTCGDSGETEIPDSIVDIVLTDPPHFDKVYYSELADFFHSWLNEITPYTGYPQQRTTRSEHDVQDQDPIQFEIGLTRVWRDVYRTLKSDGLVIFSFHHREAQGWRACMNSLRNAGFCVVNLQMVKAEMTTSLSKKNQRSPHSMDVLVICRKQGVAEPLAGDPRAAIRHARNRIRSLIRGGANPLPGDARSMMLASVLSLLTLPSSTHDPDELENVATTHAIGFEMQLLGTPEDKPQPGRSSVAKGV